MDLSPLCELGQSPLPCPPHATASIPKVCNSCEPVLLEGYAFAFKLWLGREVS